MSLVITSNEIQGTGVGLSEFQKPYTWSNHLDQPLVIPPNSEVAVQSLKVNKDGTITISPAHKFYVYFGVKLTNSISIEDVSSALHLVDLGITEPTEFTVESLAEQIKGALNRGSTNPEIFGNCDVTVVRNPEGTDFQGFRLKFEQRTNGSAVNNLPTNWINLYEGFTYGEGAGLTFNSASNTLSPINNYANRDKQYFNYALATDTPLNAHGGEYIVDITNASGSPWGVGLRRSQGVNGLPTPDEYNVAESMNGYSAQYVDFGVYAIQDNILTAGNNFKLRAFCSISDTTKLDEQYLTMHNVDYVSGNGSFTGVYDWSANGSNFTKVKFVLENEVLTVSMIDGASKEYPLLTNTGVYKKTVSGFNTPTRFPPVRDSCRMLYPTAFCGQNASNNRFLTIEKWGGRQITGLTYNNPANDWWSYLVQNNLQDQYGREFEEKPMYNMSDAQDPLVQPTYKGITTNVAEDYDHVVVLRPDDTLYTESELANSDKLLGFDGTITLTNASKSGSNNKISEYTSSSAPELKSTTSIFVRLNNLPVKSYNAGQSRRSQIVYSAPRFASGTDQSVGALFYESPEKTYVSLDNLAPINLNTLDIDIVNENETLAVDLLGKTVCTLHFREKLSK